MFLESSNEYQAFSADESFKTCMSDFTTLSACVECTMANGLFNEGLTAYP